MFHVEEDDNPVSLSRIVQDLETVSGIHMCWCTSPCGCACSESVHGECAVISGVNFFVYASIQVVKEVTDIKCELSELAE